MRSPGHWNDLSKIQTCRLESTSCLSVTQVSEEANNKKKMKNQEQSSPLPFFVLKVFSD